MHLDDAFEEIGVGIMQWCAVFFLSFTAFAEGLLTSGAFFLVPHERCEFKISRDDTDFYTTFIIGMVFGGFILGAVSDIEGRLYTLTLSTGISFVGCLTASGFGSLVGFEMGLLILGFGSAGIHLSCRVLLFELVPMSHRGRFTILMDFISNLGVICALVWSRYLLSEVHLFWFFPPFHHYQLFYFLASLICLLSCLFLKLTPYSPRQMMAHQRLVGTMVLMRKFFALNQCKHESAFTVPFIEPFTIVESRVYHRTQWSSYLVFGFRCVTSYLIDIFRCPQTLTSLILLLLNLVTFDSIVLMNGIVSQRLFHGVEYNITVWQPVNETIVKQLCDFMTPSLYATNIYLAFTSIIAVLLLVYLIDICQRRVIVVVSAAICGTCLFLLMYVRKPPFDIVSAIPLIFFHTATIVTLNVIIMETYPTKYRSSAFGFFKLIARITTVAAVSVLKTWSNEIFGILAYFMFVTMGLSLFIPNKNRKPIQE